MSNRTLLEFNHDHGFSIEDDPAAFVQTILEMIRAGGRPRTVDALENFGIAYVGQRHHSDSCSVVYKHRKVEL
jgi:hypothetical protein